MFFFFVMAKVDSNLLINNYKFKDVDGGKNLLLLSFAFSTELLPIVENRKQLRRPVLLFYCIYKFDTQ